MEEYRWEKLRTGFGSGYNECEDRPRLGPERLLTSFVRHVVSSSVYQGNFK